MATIKKGKPGHGYNYTDLAQATQAIEQMGYSYRQWIDPVITETEVVEFIMTDIIDADGNKETYRGCRVPKSTLPQSKANPAQEYGSALTYARRYSLLMAFGFATSDDDGACLTLHIGDGQAKELELLLKKAGVDVNKIYEADNISSLSELSESQYVTYKAEAEKRIKDAKNG